MTNHLLYITAFVGDYRLNLFLKVKYGLTLIAPTYDILCNILYYHYHLVVAYNVICSLKPGRSKFISSAVFIDVLNRERQFFSTTARTSIETHLWH